MILEKSHFPQELALFEQSDQHVNKTYGMRIFLPKEDRPAERKCRGSACRSSSPALPIGI
jgi:hypothetical protein